MRRIPNNIEKAVFARGEYVGYGKQGCYRIKGWSGNWQVIAPDGRSKHFSTLKACGRWIQEN